MNDPKCPECGSVAYRVIYAGFPMWLCGAESCGRVWGFFGARLHLPTRNGFWALRIPSDAALRSRNAELEMAIEDILMVAGEKYLSEDPYKRLSLIEKAARATVHEEVGG